ncbi:unnamed protein product [Lampetra fluviatilis]
MQCSLLKIDAVKARRLTPLYYVCARACVNLTDRRFAKGGAIAALVAAALCSELGASETRGFELKEVARPPRGLYSTLTPFQ